jgi:PAS domain S-box-containing protein
LGGTDLMENLNNTSERGNSRKWIATFCLLIALITGASYMGLNYYRPFHVVVEVFTAFTAFIILIMAFNTYELSKNIPFLFIGVAFGVGGAFNIIHILASNGMGFFQGETTNLSMIFSVTQRYVMAVSILICCKLFYRPNKTLTPLGIISGFSIVFITICILVFALDKFPVCYVPGYGSTSFKIASEYIISIIVLIGTIVLFRAKKYIEYNVFLLLQFYSYITITYSILLTFYTVQQEITNVLAHVLRVISFYCVYRAIVKVGLKTPYKLLFNEINEKNNSLRLKDSELKHKSHQLRKENRLRKSMEESLLKNEACYKLLIQNSRDAIIIYEDEKVAFANLGAAYLAGVAQPELLVGKAVDSILKLNVIQDLQKDSITATYETETVSIDGRITPVEVTNAYITYENKPAVLSLIRDISSHKQIEKMKKDVEEDKKLLNETLEFNRLITEFFSNISHELRTPLNVILSALQVLGITEPNGSYQEVIEKRNRYVNMMKQNCYRLLRLINNLIDITRIDSGYVTPKMQNHNIVSVVEDITTSVAGYVEHKGLRLIFDTDVEEKMIACDPEKIERIMLNLISNAVKFTEQGDLITVEILDGDEDISISVKDTGIGIPEDKLHVIFERFRQADNSLSRKHEGSGIGLSLVKALVEMHGGSISVKSTLAEGSEFTVKLPVRKIDEPDNAENHIIFQENTEKINIEFSDI